MKDFVHHSPQERLTFLKHKGQRLTRKLKEKISPAAGQEKAVELKDVLDLTNYPKDYVKYAETHWQALTKYRPRQYPGEITLFRRCTGPGKLQNGNGVPWSTPLRTSID